MFANYAQLGPWVGIIAGGMLGCLVVGLIAMSRGASFSALAGHPGKQLWSMAAFSWGGTDTREAGPGHQTFE